MSADETRSPSPAAVSDGHKSHGQGSTTVAVPKGVSFELAAGTLTAIMGPSGSGKSTLIHCCAGLSLPDKGRVSIAGQVISAPGACPE